MGPNSAQRVRFLYKTILKLHRGLPVELKVLGDEYVREEFRRHKSANAGQAEVFLHEWTDYAVQLTKQLMDIHGGESGKCLGISLTEDQLNLFQEQQLGQLYELRQEVLKTNSSKSDETKVS